MLPIHVLMIAAECKDIAKVGGLGDVVQDLALSLHRAGIEVSIVLPHYDMINYPFQYVGKFRVTFAGKIWNVEESQAKLRDIPVYLLGHKKFFSKKYNDIYIDSGKQGRGPFEDDAKRFAFFSAAAIEFICRQIQKQKINIIHCHDWHTGFLQVLLNYDKRYINLKESLRTLFTIHNLNYQGIRPFDLSQQGSLLSFKQWFPSLFQDLKKKNLLNKIKDPGSKDVLFNPMRAGINLADLVTTVSPTYAKEITRSDDASKNFIGGRGLESDLRKIKRKKKLFGIINGLDYKTHDPACLQPPFDLYMHNWSEVKFFHKHTFIKNLPSIISNLEKKLGSKFRNREKVAQKLKSYKYKDWQNRPLMVAVTRTVQQKMGILLEKISSKKNLIKGILEKNVSLIIFGMGELEDQLESINDFKNGLFICSFDPDFAEMLYSVGDLFLMPSDFEPCGISQMIAMRYGCIPIVPDIGGLHDTVKDKNTGFVYDGKSRDDAKKNLLSVIESALIRHKEHKSEWIKMQELAMQQRFEWEKSAKEYIKLYKRLLNIQG